jgi:transposase
MGRGGDHAVHARRTEHCGLVLDRDLNAARNLATLVAAPSYS